MTTDVRYELTEKVLRLMRENGVQAFTLDGLAARIPSLFRPLM